MVQTIIAFLFALGVLIVFHELGHYWVARWCNVKVLRFSVGMGKVIFSRRLGPDQTEWAISAFPLGGYVKMLDARESGQEPIPEQDLAREFTRQTVWKRIAIVGAGPFANFLLAILLLTALFVIGVPEPVAKLRQPADSTMAYRVGLRAGDQIIGVNGKPIQFWSELHWEMLQMLMERQTVRLTVRPTGSSAAYQTEFPVDQLSDADVDSDFLDKLGLDLWLSQAQLGNLLPDSPALTAGLRPDDIIVEIDGQPVRDNRDLLRLVRAAPHRQLQLKASRDGQILEFLVTPLAVPGEQGMIGKLNVEVRSMPEMAVHSESMPDAVSRAVERTWSTSLLTLKMLGRMLIGEASLKNITGPLTIADYAGQSARTGWISYLSFLAFVSISLGIMNLLPIPILDGGHLLYYSLEVLTGRPISERIWELSQRAGLAVLFVLMAIALFNDIARLLPT